MAGYIVEKTLRADEADSLNRNAIASVNVDGGNLVTFGAYDKGVFTVTPATATAALGVGMAYNPTEHLTVVNGKMFAGLSKDPRDFTNIANRPFDVFIPCKGDIVGFTADNINGAAPTAGQFLVQAANGQLKASATAGDGIAFKLLAIESLPFPQACVGNEIAPLYVCECVAN